MLNCPKAQFSLSFYTVKDLSTTSKIICPFIWSPQTVPQEIWIYEIQVFHLFRMDPWSLCCHWQRNRSLFCFQYLKIKIHRPLLLKPSFHFQIQLSKIYYRLWSTRYSSSDIGVGHRSFFLELSNILENNSIITLSPLSTFLLTGHGPIYFHSRFLGFCPTPNVLRVETQISLFLTKFFHCPGLSSKCALLSSHSSLQSICSTSFDLLPTRSPSFRLPN